MNSIGAEKNYALLDELSSVIEKNYTLFDEIASMSEKNYTLQKHPGR